MSEEKRSPFESGRYVTWEMAMGGLFTLVIILSGFAVWLLGQSGEAIAQHEKLPMHPGTIEPMVRIESKVDKVLFLLLDAKQQQFQNVVTSSTEPTKP